MVVSRHDGCGSNSAAIFHGKKDFSLEPCGVVLSEKRYPQKKLSCNVTAMMI